MKALKAISNGSIRVVLGSKSPRRTELLSLLGFEFSVRKVECEEIYPNELQGGDIAMYLSARKSRAYINVYDDELLISADTIVWMDGRVFEKPESIEKAEEMLGELSGKEHQVFTGVTLRLGESVHSFFSSTSVKFEQFTTEAIAEYVDKFLPLDKAGGYGIQDCLSEDGKQIGPLGMSIVKGSYHNVIGLPIDDLKSELSKFEVG